MTGTASEGGQRPRSAFVTAASWTAIAVLVYSVFSCIPMIPASPAPAKYRWLAHLAVSLSGIAAAAGLLSRREWGRKLFIGVISFAIPWNLHMTYIAGTMHGIAPMSIVILIAYDVFVCALFAWTIYKLSSRAIRAEFE